MRARREPVPPVGVDPDEDRLEEEGEALECEPEAKHVPEVLNPHRPQESQFKGQDRARHHPDGEQCEHDPRPPARERPVELVPGPQVPPLREQHDHGERDTEAHQRDVHGQRQRLHLPRFEQVVLIHVHRCQPIPVTTCRSRPGPGKARRQRSSTQPCHFPVWRWAGDSPPNATRGMVPPRDPQCCHPYRGIGVGRASSKKMADRWTPYGVSSDPLSCIGPPRPGASASAAGMSGAGAPPHSRIFHKMAARG